MSSARQTEHAIIVAGGQGARFGAPVPKQFIELAGKPVLVHTLEKFYQYAADIRIVLVLPAADIARWRELERKFSFPAPLTICTSGATRFESVRNGLVHVPDEQLVAIHDAVRPLVTPALIAQSFAFARQHGAAIPVVPLKESIRALLPDGSSEVADRSRFRLVQTPQTFQSTLIRRAYAAASATDVTDDAAVAEQAGLRVFLFEGSYSNIKITTPDDLAVAAALGG